MEMPFFRIYVLGRPTLLLFFSFLFQQREARVSFPLLPRRESGRTARNDLMNGISYRSSPIIPTIYSSN